MSFVLFWDLIVVAWGLQARDQAAEHCKTEKKHHNRDDDRRAPEPACAQNCPQRPSTIPSKVSVSTLFTKKAPARAKRIPSTDESHLRNDLLRDPIPLLMFTHNLLPLA